MRTRLRKPTELVLTPDPHEKNSKARTYEEAKSVDRKRKQSQRENETSEAKRKRLDSNKEYKKKKSNISTTVSSQSQELPSQSELDSAWNQQVLQDLAEISNKMKADRERKKRER